MFSRTKDRVSESQVWILKLLLDKGKDRGLTRSQIKEGSGVTNLVRDLGPPYKEDAGKTAIRFRGHKNLVAKGYVEPYEDIASDGNGNAKATVYYRLTDEGRKAARFYQVRKRGQFTRVPADLLNKAVLGVKAKRVYGIERFTNDDLDEVRRAMPADYVMVPLDDIRQQIVNQRKQGAYADPEKTNFARKMHTLKGMVKLYWSEQIDIDEIVSWLERKGESPSTDDTPT